MFSLQYLQSQDIHIKWFFCMTIETLRKILSFEALLRDTRNSVGDMWIADYYASPITSENTLFIFFFFLFSATLFLHLSLAPSQRDWERTNYFKCRKFINLSKKICKLVRFYLYGKTLTFALGSHLRLNPVAIIERATKREIERDRIKITSRRSRVHQGVLTIINALEFARSNLHICSKNIFLFVHEINRTWFNFVCFTRFCYRDGSSMRPGVCSRIHIKQTRAHFYAFLFISADFFVCNTQQHSYLDVNKF